MNAIFQMHRDKYRHIKPEPLKSNRVEKTNKCAVFYLLLDHLEDQFTDPLDVAAKQDAESKKLRLLENTLL